MNAFNPAQFRAQFPALTDAGVYLDSAATALKPQAVIDATHQFYSLSAGNVHRSQFAEAQRLTARYEAARGKVAQWLNAPDDASIVWTRGTTEAINMVAQCYARPRLQPGDEIIVSEAEHHANLVPWLMVAQQTGAKIVKLPLNALFLPDVERLPELITPRSRILALGQMSNVTGGCPDLARAITLAHAAGMVVMVDGAQGAVHFPADVQQVEIDFYAFSAHRLCGSRAGEASGFPFFPLPGLQPAGLRFCRRSSQRYGDVTGRIRHRPARRAALRAAATGGAWRNGHPARLFCAV